MGKPQNNTNADSYENSHLAHLLTKILLKITELEKKYPPQKTDSMEKRHASKLVGVAKKVLVALNKELLPKFSHQKKPGLLGIVTDLIGLRNIGEDLYTRKYAFFMGLAAALPAIMKEASKAGTESNTNAVVEILNRKKNDLFAKVATIPGASLDSLMLECNEALAKLGLDDMKQTSLKDPSTVESLISRLKDILFTSDGQKITLTVAHPMSFELVELVMVLVKEAPLALCDLVPFFNPQALVVDLHSGLAGMTIKALTKETFQIEQRLDTSSDDKAYDYRLIRHIEKDQKITDFNIATYYHDYRQRTIEHLLQEVKQYFTSCENSTGVKSEMARGQLLQNLVTAESERIAELVLNHELKCNQDHSGDEATGLQHLFALGKDINHVQILLTDTHKIQKALTDKSSEYKTLAVSALLKRYPQLDQQLLADQNASLDIAYCQLPAPEHLAGFSGENIGLIAIKSKLDSVIQNQSVALQTLNSKLEQTLRERVGNLQEARAKWHRERQEDHAKSMASYQRQLDNCQQLLNEHAKTDTDQSIDNNNSLTLSIQTVTNNALQLKELQKTVEALLEQAQESSRLSQEEILLDEDNVLNTSLMKQSTAIVERAQIVLQQLESIQTQQQKKQHNLERDREKMESEALALESLKTADPNKMKQTVLELEQQIETLKRKQKEPIADEDPLAARVSTETNTLTKLTLEMNRITEEAHVLDNERRKLISDLFISIDKHLPNTRNPQVTEEQLLQNVDLFNEYINSSVNRVTQEKDQLTTDYLNKVTTVLADASECLNKNKRSYIPFKEIDKLPSIQSMEKSLPKSHTHKGFNLLLHLIDEMPQLEQWKEYRSRQDDLFRFKPKEQEFLQQLPLLQNAIIKATTNNKTLLEKDQFKNTLIEVKNKFHNNVTQQTNADNNLVEIKKQIAQCSLLENKSDQQLPQQSTAPINLEKECIALENKKNALNTLIELIEDIGQYKQSIAFFEKNDAQTYIDESLYNNISALKQSESRLTKIHDEVTLAINSLDDPGDLQASLLTTGKLLKSANASLSFSINLKLGLTPLSEQISANIGLAKALKQSFLQLANPNMPSETLASLVSTLTDHFQSLCENTKHQQQNIEKLVIRLNDLHDSSVKLEIQNLQQSQNLLLDALRNAGNALLTNLTALLESHKNGVLAEEASLQACQPSRLSSLRKQLEALPSDECLDALIKAAGNNPPSNETNSSLANFKLARKHVTERLIQREQDIMLQHANERAALVDEDLCPKLEAYLLARNSSYVLKDTFSSNDKNQRELFINSLKEKLAEFKTSGDNIETLELIRKNRGNFPGTNLQPILNVMMVKIIDFSRKINNNLPLTMSDKEQVESMHKRALELLDKHAPNHPAYSDVINKFYDQISHMRDYSTKLAETNAACALLVANLAARLENDIDHFVIAHPENIPEIEAFNQFKDHFTARLRSEDEAMSQHSSWQAIIANILINLATLGLALGYRLIESKIRTGRSSFLFFNETEVQSHISSVEVSVNRLTAPAV